MTQAPSAHRADRLARLGFDALVLALFVAYTAIGWSLDFTSAAGQPGPGFLPHLIGIAGIILTLIDFAGTAARPQSRSGDAAAIDRSSLFRATGYALALFAFVILLPLLGAIGSAVTFAVATAFLFNREHWVRVAATSVIVIGIVWVVFDVFLNTGLPVGRLFDGIF